MKISLEQIEQLRKSVFSSEQVKQLRTSDLSLEQVNQFREVSFSSEHDNQLRESRFSSEQVEQLRASIFNSGDWRIYIIVDQHLANFRPDISYLLSPRAIDIFVLRNPYCSFEPFLRRLPPIYAAVWSNIGGAELVSSRSFDLYQFGDLSRRVEGARSSCRVRISSRLLADSSSVL
ncbi:tetraspanin-7-like [Dorcoceras hygrometricum]|uniref:Tetraspanin-7-like n=1 Tax=Dorcoceras hygrometricum TaxID=472368 RepID=A0A2Z7DCV1_9LAMI|nr:tetraspanin-7-like [Dorcoceras hygrometricum]